MKKSELKQLIKEEIQNQLREGMSIDKHGNLLGIPDPPPYDKVKDSIVKIENFVESMISRNPNKLIKLAEPRHEWKVLDLNINDISDVIIMHGNDVFYLPTSNYSNISLRIIEEYHDIQILLWTPNQSLPILDPKTIGNTYGKGIISFKYKGKLIGNDFTKDLNYELGSDKKYRI